MSKNQKIALAGVAHLKVINTPKFFNDMAKEAYNIFDNDEAVEMMSKISNAKDTDNESFVTPNIAKKTVKGFNKYMYNGGVVKKFIDCKVEFELKDKQTLVHDILAEITLRDGIVTKIEKVNPIRFTKKDLKPIEFFTKS